MSLITITKLVYQWQCETLNNKLCYCAGNKTNAGNTGTLPDVTTHHTTQRTVRGVVDRVHRHKEDVRDCCIQSNHSLILDTRIIECQYIEHSERQSRPQYPRTILTPLRLCLIAENTNCWVNKSIDDTSYEENTTCDCSIQTKDISVKLQLENHHHLENQICRCISQRVSDLFSKANFHVGNFTFDFYVIFVCHLNCCLDFDCKNIYNVRDKNCRIF